MPTYNPTVVYGGWAYPDYPPYYFGPEGYGYGGILAFGPGFGITRDWDWDRFDWREHRVHVDRDRMSWWDRGRPERFRADRAAGDFWMHNPEHRRGVDYRNPALRERYQNANIAPDQRQGRDRTWGTPQGASPNVEGPAANRGFPNGQFQRTPERLQQGNAEQNGRSGMPSRNIRRTAMPVSSTGKSATRSSNPGQSPAPCKPAQRHCARAMCRVRRLPRALQRQAAPETPRHFAGLLSQSREVRRRCRRPARMSRRPGLKRRRRRPTRMPRHPGLRRLEKSTIATEAEGGESGDWSNSSSSGDRNLDL